MPTGYTAPVVDGKIVEFRDFALSCARAFGALITMRDDPMDAAIPDRIEPHDYNKRRLEQAHARHQELLGMTAEQITAAAAASFKRASEERAKWEAERQQENDRLTAMLSKVERWTPPTTEHVGLKEFMINQLKLSLNGPIFGDPPKLLSPEEWLKAELENVDHDIQYHAAEHAKEVERANGRAQWLQSLHASLVGQ